MTFSDTQSAALHMIAKHNGTLAVTDFGHGYGKAKFASRCPLTGIEIQWGEAMRKVEIVTKHGTRWEGYTSNAIFAILGKHGVNSIYAETKDGKVAVSVSRWTKCGGEWVARLAESMEAAVDGTTIRVMDKDGQEKAWTRRGNQWLGGTGYTRSSASQVLSGLRRSKRYRLHMVEAA